MANARTKVDALKDLGEKVTGATLVADENETIVGMIDKITDNYSGGGENGGASVLKLNTEFVGTLPIQLEVEDTEDIENLNAINQDYLTNGKLPPMFIQIEQGDQYEIATLTKVSTNESGVILQYNCSTSEYNGQYVFGKLNNVWHAMYSTGHE